MKYDRAFALLFAVVALPAVVLPTPARAAGGPCSEPGGVPLAEDGFVSCTIDASLAEASAGRSISSATFGLVREVRVKSVIRLPLSLGTLGDVLSEHAIQIPPQDVSIDIVFNDGRALPVAITIAPAVAVEGVDACALVATSASINLSRFESGLPDWIDATFVRYVNDNAELRSKLLDGANAGLSRLQRQYCF